MTELPASDESLILLSDHGPKQEKDVSLTLEGEVAATPFWLHFDVESPIASTWLKEKSGVDPFSVESMLSLKVRPRVVIHENSLLVILRVPDTLQTGEHEELRSLRIYADENRVISTSFCRLPVVKELIDLCLGGKIKQGKAVDLFMELIIRSIRGLEFTLDDLEDQTDDLEEQALDSAGEIGDSDIANLTLDALGLRRCLVPQREVLFQLASTEVHWLSSAHRKRLKLVHERVSRQLEETELIRDRCRIIREQRNSHMADLVNQRLYLFSLLAVVFLPLGFLTGLLGVNLAGIPGADHPLSFLGFCGVLALLTVAIMTVFKYLKWF